MGLIDGGSSLAAGLALGTTYVLSVGPNNMMIIREGLVRGRVCLVASLILAVYVALLLLSYGMTDAIGSGDTTLTTLLSCFGAGAMVWFAVLSVRAAIERTARRAYAQVQDESLVACLRRVALVVSINPLVYIEFLIIPAGALAAFKDQPLRAEFLMGLIVMSAVACYGYAIGGRACARLFEHQRALQVFDLICGCVLASLAVTIGFSLIQVHRL